jgi:hypothetical protein
MTPLVIITISRSEKVIDLLGIIFIIAAIVLWIYGSFHAILYDDEMKKTNPRHLPFRSIGLQGGFRFGFGLPIPIIDKSCNTKINKYRAEYNRINILFWIVLLLAIITNSF